MTSKQTLLVLLLGSALGLGCKSTENAIVRSFADGGVASAVAGNAEALAKQCGIDIECKAGIGEGNASISGVTSVDAFFASVLNYERSADHLSADLNAHLDAIRADFGIDANADLKSALDAQIAQNCDGGVSVHSEPARCAADTQAALDALAKCDTEIDPAKVTMMCDGRCDVETNVDVDCGADAQLSCTVNPPMGSCSGSCDGTCETKLDAAAKCDGICRGSCDGNCSAFSDDAGTQCAGSCDGMCQGSCEAQLQADASCSGTCHGECTVMAGGTQCNGAVKAHCEQMSSTMVSCKGRCEGTVVPPKAKAECEAHARAEAKLNVTCTPPRLVLDYKLKSGVDADSQAHFVAAVENLRVRLPGLLASLEQANSVTSAGTDLVNDAGAALKSGIDAAKKAVERGDLRVLFGLTCAARDADQVADAIKDSSDRLAKSVGDCAGVKSAVGMP